MSTEIPQSTSQPGMAERAIDTAAGTTFTANGLVNGTGQALGFGLQGALRRVFDAGRAGDWRRVNELLRARTKPNG